MKSSELPSTRTQLMMPNISEIDLSSPRSILKTRLENSFSTLTLMDSNQKTMLSLKLTKSLPPKIYPNGSISMPDILYLLEKSKSSSNSPTEKLRTKLAPSNSYQNTSDYV